MFSLKSFSALALGLAGLVFSTAAMAASAQVTTALNVRAGPGTSFPIIGAFSARQVIEVDECLPSGWCYVTHRGLDGWVSGRYLAPVSTSSGTTPDCRFGITLGGSGPDFSIDCGPSAPTPAPAPSPTPTPTPTPTPAPISPEACFYSGINFSGSEQCYGPGIQDTLPAAFDDEISSIRLFGGAKANICTQTHLSGTCVNITVDKSTLESGINNQTSSLRVFTGAVPSPAPAPAPAPTTFSTGSINLNQTYRANLDNGGVGGSGTDIWFQAETAASKYIVPVNGAAFAIGNGSNRGYAGCAAASFTTARIPLSAAPVGTYICAKTTAGRISQFRINGITLSALQLGYTTWAD